MQPTQMTFRTLKLFPLKPHCHQLAAKCPQNETWLGKRQVVPLADASAVLDEVEPP